MRWFDRDRIVERDWKESAVSKRRSKGKASNRFSVTQCRWYATIDYRSNVGELKRMRIEYPDAHAGELEGKG